MRKNSYLAIQFANSIWVLWAICGYQTAVAQANDMVAKLKQSQTLTCIPEETVFCSNVHVNCAGRTKIPTFTFKVQSKANAITLTVPPAFKEFTETYQNIRVEWDEEGQAVVINPSDNKGYIKISKDGQYVFRHYPRQQEGVMSIGKCEP